MSQKLMQKTGHLLHALLHNLFVFFESIAQLLRCGRLLLGCGRLLLGCSRLLFEFLFESVETIFCCELWRRDRRTGHENEYVLYVMWAFKRQRVSDVLQQPWFLRLIIDVAGSAYVCICDGVRLYNRLYEIPNAPLQSEQHQ